MSLSDAMKKMKYDSRLTDYMLRQGEVTEKEVKEHLEQLQDVSNNSEKIKLFDSEKDQDTATH